MVEIKNVSYKYKNGKTVLEDINLEIKKRRNCLYNRKKRVRKIELSKAYCRNHSAKQRRYIYLRDKYER